MSALPSAIHLDDQDQPMQATRSDQMSVRTIDLVSSAVCNPAGGQEGHPVRIQPQYRVSTPHYSTWVDESPIGDAKWGGKMKFNFGLGGFCYLTGVELHVELSPCVITGNTGGDATYQSYIAERILGDDYTLKYQNEILKRQSVDAMHFRRRIEANVNNTADEGYQAAAGADPAVTYAGGKFHVPLDICFKKHKPMVSIANASEIELRFTIPSFSSVVRALDPADCIDGVDMTAYSNTAADAAAPIRKMFLRCHYVEVDQVHRYNLSTAMLAEGVKYHVSETEVGESKAAIHSANIDPASQSLQTLQLSTTQIQPSSYLIGVVRYLADLAVPGTGAAGAGDFAAATPALAEVFAATGNRSSAPDRFNVLPCVAWTMKEKNRNFYERCTLQYYGQTLHPQLFPSEIHSVPVAIQTFNQFPMTSDDHSLGHISFSVLEKPTFDVEYRAICTYNGEDNNGLLNDFDLAARSGVPAGARDAADYSAVGMAGTTVQVVGETFSINYNFLHIKNGRIFILWQ